MSEDAAVERKVRVQNHYGLHARPAAELVKLASTFDADITISKESLEVNGKSIMGVMMLAAEYGTELTFRADGDDAREAVDQLCELVETQFGEE